jgi:non-specific serine/threonine protein kinase
VIHFDRWWNPAVENQATDRSFRIGQQRPVLVHKFVCQGTIEEKIAQMISDKTLLSAKVLSSKKNEADLNITEMTDAELLELVTLDIQKVRMLEDL